MAEDGKLRVGETPEFLDTTLVDTTAGDDLHREGVFIGDPTEGSYRAAVGPAGFPSGTSVLAVDLRDGPGFDAFGRFRVSSPNTIFATSFEYDEQPLLWESYTAGNGAISHSTTSGMVTVSTGGAASGDRGLRQTYVYFRYQPGKSQLVKMTGIPLLSGTPTGNAKVEWAYGDDDNAMGYGVDVVGNYLFIRSTAGGTALRRLDQDDWNLDKLDGTGSSGVILANTAAQILIIDFQWLGVGKIRFGFQIGSGTVYVHEIIHSNNGLTTPYTKTGNLPVRIEAFNDGGAGADIATAQICTAIESEGGVHDVPGLTICMPGTAPGGAKTVGTTIIPIWSIRLKNTFEGITYRGHIHVEDIETMLVGTNLTGFWFLKWNATLTGATFANDVDTTYSGVEYDIAATAISGGVTLDHGFLASGSASGKIGLQAQQAFNKMMIARNYANTERDTLTLSAVLRSSSGPLDTWAMLSEIR